MAGEEPRVAAEPPEDQDSFVRRLYPKLVGGFALRGFSVEEAEDLAQDTLVRVIQHWDQVCAATSPDAWAHRAALNLSNSWLRRLRVARRRLPVLASSPAVEGDHAAVLALRGALASLPPRQREAVIYRFWAQLPVAECADLMGCAEGTVRALTAQGVAALRSVLGPGREETA